MTVSKKSITKPAARKSTTTKAPTAKAAKSSTTPAGKLVAAMIRY